MSTPINDSVSPRPNGYIPPNNVDAERSVLGSMLIDIECINEIMTFLRPDDFYMDTHRKIFEAITQLYSTGTPIDIITVSDLMEKEGTLEKSGGISYLAEITTNVPTTSNFLYYARIVSDRAKLRKLISIANTINKMCYSNNDESETVLETARQLIFNMDRSGNRKELEQISVVAVDALVKLEERYKNQGKFTGVATGFRELDRKTSGFQKGNLVLLAARPGVGKSAFALNLSINTALTYGTQIAFFSLEMSKEELINRIICSLALIDNSKMKSGEFDREDWMAITACMGKIASAPMYLDDTTGVTISDIRAKCQKLKMEKGLGLIVIDYLQLMQGKGKVESRQQEIAEITRSLKLLAKDLEVPVLALSQLSRAAEGRKKPMLSDLRESGAIEQDADIVMFLCRTNDDTEEGEQNTESAAEPDTVEVELAIAKHRSGSLGSIPLNWTGKYTRFDNAEYGYDE